MRKFDDFLDDLSNWYIRRNRRRFWKTEDDKDKLTAYFVLYNVLVDTIKTMAPILPFICEEIYQNLVSSVDNESPESVHLCDYPEVDNNQIDLDLIKKVDALRKVVELGRSARNRSNIRIRQPLSELRFSVEENSISEFIFSEKDVIMDELNVKSINRAKSESELINYKIKPNLPLLGQKYGKDLKKIVKQLDSNKDSHVLEEIRKNKKFQIDKKIFILREDLIIEQDSQEGWTCSGDDSIAVGLDKHLTDDLIKEGVIRDIIRQVQTMRKDANFAVEDRIKIYIKADGLVGDSIIEFKELFMNEILAVEIVESTGGSEFSGSFKMNDQVFTVGLERVKIERK